MTKTKTAILSIITLFVIVFLFCLAGCQKRFDFDASFSQSEISISLGEGFDASSYISSSQPLNFTSSDQQVLTPAEEGGFVANKSGVAIVSAWSEDILIDTIQVYVKYKFLTPSNLSISNDGVLTWDKSDIILNGTLQQAQYQLQISYGDEETLQTSATNSFTFSQQGFYTVSVQAIANGEVDASAQSSQISFYLDGVQGVQNFVAVSGSDFASQKITFSWSGAQEADLTVGGVTKHVQGNKAEYDFSYYPENARIQTGLVLHGEDGQSRTFNKTITKIETPQPQIDANVLTWQKGSGVKNYLINVNNQQGEFVTLETLEGNSTILQGLPEGVYNISFQAIAQQDLANGNVKTLGQSVGKIKNVDVEYKMVGEKVQITFSTDSPYNRRVIVTQNNRTFDLRLSQQKDGKYYLTQEFDLQPNENIFSVQAIPTLEEGDFVFDGQTASLVLMSDEKVFLSAYNIAEFSDISHYTQQEASYLEFDSLEFANDYQVSINDKEVEDVQIEYNQGRTILNIGKITKAAYGDSQQFNIKVTATRKSAEAEITKPSVAEKTLTMLEAPTLNNLQGSGSQQTYSWKEKSGAKYEITLFVTQSDYQTEDIEPKVWVSESPEITGLLANYYVLQVRSLPTDENNFLASEEYAQDHFFVAQSMDAPSIRLDYDESVAQLQQNSGYVLTISTVEFGYEYVIKIDENVVGRVFNENFDKQTLTYNFEKQYDFTENGQDYNITVEVLAKDEAQQLIHTSTTSTLLVHRLAMPMQVIVEENATKARFVNDDERATLTVIKDGEELTQSQSGEDASVSVNEYDGDFQIKARLNGYQDFEEFTTNGTVNLPSALATFTFHRSQAPSQLNYSQEEISFEHSDKATAYQVEITVKSNNGQITRSFQTQNKTFNLEDEIANLRASDSVFDSYFTQKTQIVIRVYANINSQEEAIYYLPSRYASIKHDVSKTELEISKLDEVVLNFDEQQQILSWQGVSSENPQYLVYLGDELQQTITAPASSGLYQFSLADYDFLQPGDYEFYVIAKSDNSLQSDASASIIFHKISGVEQLRVFRQGDKYFASFQILGQDVNYVTDILVNDISIGNVAQFELSASSYDIVLKGTNFGEDGNQIYFVSSTPSHFDIAPLQISTYNAQADISENKLTWEDFSSFIPQWALTTPELPLKYEVRVLKEAEAVRTISNLDQPTLQLSNSQLVNLLNGDYTISIYAYLDEYTISLQGKGYHGVLLLQDGVAVKKLDAVEELTASVDPSQGTIEQEFEKTVQLEWQFNGTNTSEVVFEVYVNDSLVSTTTQTSVQLEQSLFELSQNKVAVKATSKTDISSDENSVTVKKFQTPTIKVDDRGVLSIQMPASPSVSAGFVVEITVEDPEGQYQQTFVSLSASVDLQKYINGKSGAIAIRVVPAASQEVCLPSQEVALLNSRILATPKLIQDQTGFTLSSTDEGVTFYILCQETGETVQLDGNHFNIPEEWNSGTYHITPFARKSGNIDSWTGESAKLEVNITRVDNVSSITFTRTDDYLDHILSWEAVDNSSGYEIEIYKDGALIGKIGDLKDLQINLSALQAVQESGEYVFKFRTITDFDTTGLTNSQQLTTTVSVMPNTISNISANDDGLLSFEAQSEGVGIYLNIKDADGNEHQPSPQILASDVREYLVKDLTGQLQIVLRQLYTNKTTQIADEQNSKIVIDAQPQKQAIYKLQDIVSVATENQNGKIVVSLAEEEGTRQFYVKFTDKNGLETVQKIDFEKVNNSTYEFLAIELCEKFALTNNEQCSFKIYSTIDGTLRSDESEFTFKFRQSNNTVLQDKASETEDYIIIKDINGDGQVNQNITTIHLRADQGKGYDYLDVDVAQTKGYWITHTYTQNDKLIVEKSFSLTAVEAEGYTCEECYAVNISKLLEHFNAGEIDIQVGYITSTTDNNFIVNAFAEAVEYQKLRGPSNLQIDQGNLKWENSQGPNTGFVINLEDGVADEKIVVSAKDATYYLGESIKKTGEFEVSIQAVSSQLGILPSNKLYYEKDNQHQKVRKLNEIENSLSITDGVMTLEFNDLRAAAPSRGDDESVSEYIDKHLDSLERRLAKRGDASFWTPSSFASRLLTDILKYPFDYNIEELENLTFNLKFVNDQTQQEYLTSVKAINILSKLNQTTLEEMDDMINGLGQNDYKTRLSAVYNLLTNKQYFNGVASDSLLFDEIGQGETGLYNKYSAEKIPAGTYTIYIQQQGSAENDTLSSAFTSKLQNVKVIASPQTRVGSNPSDGTTEYYIKFRPVEQYQNYSLVLKDKNADETLKYNPIVKYDIYYDGSNWTRSSFQGERVTLQTDGEYVVVSINSKQTGIIYEENIKDIHGASVSLEGRDFTANIYVNGDSTSLNSKTEQVSVTFLKFDITSLKLDAGVLYWENFSVSNKLYSTKVAYVLKGTEKQEIVVPGQKPQLSFDKAGTYTYVSFCTAGKAEGFSIEIDSPVYTIYNLQKLAAPDIKVQDGEFVISDTNNNFVPKEFLISNNIYNQTKDEMLQLSTNGKESITHQTGVNRLTSGSSDAYEYRLTERSANVFYFATAGDSFKLTAQDLAGSDKDGYEITINANGQGSTAEYSPIYMQSQTVQTNAAKLQNSSSKTIWVGEGDVHWSQAEGLDRLQLPEDLTIVYEVEVNYYYQVLGSDNTVEWQLSSQDSKTYYTTQTTLTAENIVDPTSTDEYRYSIYVRAHAYLPSNAGTITTIEGERFATTTDVQYTDETTFILEGELYFSGDAETQLLTRTSQVENLKITDGKISWMHPSATSFEVYSVRNGMKSLLSGEVELVDDGTKMYSFTLSQNEEQLKHRESYDIVVIAKQTSKIDSNTSYMLGEENVKILSPLEESDYRTEEVAIAGASAQNVKSASSVDFSEYFNRSLITNKNNFVLQVDVMGASGSIGRIIIGNKTKLNIQIVEGIQSISVEDGIIKAPQDTDITISVLPIPNPEDPSVNTILSAYKATQIVFSNVEWSDDDLFYFDEDAQTFYWTFGAEFKDRALAGAKLYKDDAGSPLGLEKGLTLDTATVLIEQDAYLPIVYYISGVKHIYYVDATQVGTKLEKEKVVVFAQQRTVSLFEKTGEEMVDSGLKISYGINYDFGAASWKVVFKMPFESQANEYYVPATAILTENIADEVKFVVQSETPMYTDANLENQACLPEGMELSVVDYDESKPYQKIVIGQTEIYVATEQVYHYLQQKDDQPVESVHFKVTIETEYNYYEGVAYLHTVNSTRAYDNLSLGERVFEFGDYNVSEEGIYVGSFEPNLIGKILSFYVQARKTQNNLLSSQLGREYSENEVPSFGLFESGDGSQNNPYQINSAQQFGNISFRSQKQPYHNSYGEKIYRTKTTISSGSIVVEQNDKEFVQINDPSEIYYFKQTKDLVAGEDVFDVDGFMIGSAFTGQYNGDGHTIKINIKGLSNLSEAISTRIASSATNSQALEFNQGAALFKEIGANGVVENLKIDFSLTFDNAFATKLDSGSALVGGLVLVNNGTISNVTVTNSAVEFASAMKAGSALAVAPVIAENRGTTNSLASQSEVTINNAFSQTAQNFMYGGVVGFNNSSNARLNLAQNHGNIQVQFANNRNGYVMVGGVAISNVAGIVEMCLNSGSVRATNNSGSAYTGGVIVHSYGGEIYYTVNTGLISGSYAGGISQNGVSVKMTGVVGMGKVNNAYNNLFMRSATYTSDSGKNYTYASYNPSGITNEKITADKNIDCRNSSYQIQIKYTDANNYSVQIVKIA